MRQRVQEGPMRKRSLELGFATEEQMDAMATAWEKWIEVDDSSLGIMNGEVIVRKK